MKSKETAKKRFYLKWPWNVLVYIILVVVLRIFSIPVILLIMWWNKKQQPDGPEEGYCLQRTRGRLTGLIWAALCLVGGGLAIWFFLTAQSMPYEAARLKEEMSFGYYLIPVAGAAAMLVGLFLAYRSLRDALVPEKSALAQSIRNQLPYPDEAPPVKELFAMVDQDLKQNGQWCGKLGVGKEWVLGDEVSSIPRIRGVFSRVERHTRHAGKRTQVTYIYEIWIVDERRERQVTTLKSRRELEEAMDCLRRRAPAAVFGVYDSKEYQDLVYTKAGPPRAGTAGPKPGAYSARWLRDLPDYLGHHLSTAASARSEGRDGSLPTGTQRSFPGTGTHIQPFGLPGRWCGAAYPHPAGGVLR